MIVGKYRNKKKQTVYIVLSRAIDCTNVRDGTSVVIYYQEKSPDVFFVREKSEFLEKFEFIE